MTTARPPRARRRARQQIGSTALRLLTRIVTDRDTATLTAVPLDQLEEAERAAYELVIRHLRLYRHFPTVETLAEQGLVLPPADESLEYYRDQTSNLLVSRAVAEAIAEAQQALNDQDGQAAAAALGRVHATGVIGIAQYATFGETVGPVQDARDPRHMLHAIVPTGIRALDTHVGGVPNGNLWALAARPGVGKTYLQLAGALALARAGWRVLLISKEMTHDEINVRLINMVTNTTPDLGVRRLMSHHALRVQNERLAAVREEHPEVFDNIIMPDHNAIRTPLHVEQAIRDTDPQITLIDGTYFLRPSDYSPRMTRTETYDALIRELRTVARVQNRTIGLTWQLNRTKSMSTEGLYGTDALSQDAALVVTMSKTRREPEMRTAKVTKNRYGAEDVTFGVSFAFKPTRVGEPADLPGSEDEEGVSRRGRDRHVWEVVSRAEGRRPEAASMDDDAGDNVGSD